MNYCNLLLGSSPAARGKVKRIVTSARRLCFTAPSLEELYHDLMEKKCKHIQSDPSHPLSSNCEELPSESYKKLYILSHRAVQKIFCTICCETSKYLINCNVLLDLRNDLTCEETKLVCSILMCYVTLWLCFCIV